MKTAFRYTFPLIVRSHAAEDPDDPPPDDDKPMDAKTLKAVNKVVHAALAERDKRDAAKRKKEIDDSVSAAWKTGSEQLMESIKGLIPAKDDQPPPDDRSKGGKGAAVPPELAQQMRDLQKKIDDANAEREKLTKSVEEERAKATAADDKARRQEEAQIITTLVNEAKIRPALARMTIADVHARFVTREKAEDGTYGDPKWKDDDGELVDVKKGFAKFLTTDEGKELLPAVNAGGKGSGRPGSTGGGDGKGFGFGDLGNRLSGGGR